VLAEACRQAVAWGADGPSIAINLSARQFQDPELFADVKATLSASGVDPRRLRIEITEHLLISDLGGAIATLNLLRQLGVTIAIDDFGTGYSSLDYLRDLPIDAIKLDRSFITEIGPNGGALPIIEGITTLSHILGLAVTAEGIETSHQLARLREIGCDRGQGFLLGRPAPSGPIPPRPIVAMSPLPSVITNRRQSERRRRLAP